MLKYCDKDGIEKTIIDNENINDYVSGKGFSDFFHNNDLKIINDNGDIEIGESSDVNTHVTRITNDCNMAFELTVEGDMGVGGSIGIEGDMDVGGNINQIGPLANLTTDAKNNLVSAINEAAAEKDKYWGGTTKKWEQFETDHPAEAAKVEVRYITDDSETGSVVDAVKDGDMRAVTSNAVYDAMNNVSYSSISGISCTSGTVDSASYAKNGKIITLSIHLNNCTLTTSGQTTLHLELPNTIPRPPFTVHGVAAYFNNDTDKTGHCKLQDSGSIIVYSDKEDDGMEGLHVWLSLTYVSR